MNFVWTAIVSRSKPKVACKKRASWRGGFRHDTRPRARGRGLEHRAELNSYDTGRDVQAARHTRGSRTRASRGRCTAY